MNLVQRMVAENLQSITSIELAEASGIDHGVIRKWLDDNRRHFEKHDAILQNKGSYDILNASQAMLAFCRLPSLSNSNKAWELSDLAETLMVTAIKAREGRGLN